MREFEKHSVLKKPLSVIRALYQGRDVRQDIGVSQWFRKFINQNRSDIPLLAGPESQKLLTPKSLVRVLGMVQDQLPCDFCLGIYDVVEEKTGRVQSTQCGLWLEQADAPPPGHVHRPDKNMLVPRKSLYVTQIPNLAYWVEHERATPGEGLKSACDCIIRLYFNLGDKIPMNTACEFIGVWSPAIEGGPHVLNCIWIEELGSGWPLSPNFKLNKNAWEEDMYALKPHIPVIRNEILELITKVLKGNQILANYILLHMISSVPKKRGFGGEVMLGYFVLNITGCPDSKEENCDSFAIAIHRLYESLFPKVHLCHMNRLSMNKERWVPMKNHETETLEYGRLQNTSDTFLIVNETALSDGKLVNNGVLNIRSLNTLVTEQRIEFDFVWSTVPFETSMPVIILSHGKSIINCNAMVHLSKTPEALEISDLLKSNCKITGTYMSPSCIDALFDSLHPDKLLLWRKYILLSRQLNEKGMTMDESCSQLAQRCFVATRAKNPDFTEKDFHYQLNILRAITMSYGESKMTITRYNEMRTLEEDRIAALPERLKKRKSRTFSAACMKSSNGTEQMKRPK